MTFTWLPQKDDNVFEVYVCMYDFLFNTPCTLNGLMDINT